MRIIRDLASCPTQYKGAVIALGNFDGIHLGHQAILAQTAELAKAAGCKPAVMTFEPHPREFFSKAHEKLRIYSLRRKLELLRKHGMECAFVMRFNGNFSAISADSFIRNLLHKQLAVRHVVTGHNFAFGSGRTGNTETLAATAKELGFGFTACPPVCDAQGQPVSSSGVRTALAAGDMARAAELLGRPYTIEGHVQRGHRRGHVFGFPTANIKLTGLFKPRFGVYAVRVLLDGKWRQGVASLGVNPVFTLPEPLLEAHIFDMDTNLYGQRLRVELSEFLREEQHFESTQALIEQIALDAAKAKIHLAKL